ncbi:protein RKD5-like [Musa acuminata AAA Group]|uniref:protein RKD5-like n=1 Tax=Musa acuminata AAA Group TaxID=214697 RepID=UPI0031E130B0
MNDSHPEVALCLANLSSGQSSEIYRRTLVSLSSAAPWREQMMSSLFYSRKLHSQSLVFGAELIRSLHGYQVSEEEEEWVEREFLFSPSSCIEMRDPIPGPIMVASTAGDGGNGFRYRFKEGQSVGLWRCILAFDSTVAFSASSSPIPPLLCLSRNPRLKNIPTLLGDLQEAFQLRCEMETKNTISLASKGIQVREGKEPHDTAEYADTGYEDGSSDSCSTIRHVKLRNQKNHRTLQELAISMKKKKRAATEHVANIALTDLVKYFDLPITEASKYLRVGLTVLKRKCREFGIPRWPHRKIKSLDNLIQNLQEEVHRQEKENKSAAMKAVIKRQRMLEGEKECIEKNPFMELQIETKRFRQDVFKRRHRAKALVSKQDFSTSPMKACT